MVLPSFWVNEAVTTDEKLFCIELTCPQYVIFAHFFPIK